MNLKEFFMPNKLKAVVFISIMLISILLGILSLRILLRILSPIVPPTGWGLEYMIDNYPQKDKWDTMIYKFLFFITDFLFLPFIIIPIIPIIPIFLIKIPITLIYWYLLSCLIVWTYDKFKKKK